MSTLGPILIWVIGFLALAGLLIMADRRQQRRQKAFTETVRALASELGWTVVNGNGALSVETYRFGTDLFRKAEPSAAHAIEGTIGGLRAVLFEYSYERGSGDEAQTVRQTVTAFSNKAVSLPAFDLRKKQLSSRLSFHKIKIENSPEFSKRFVVTGADASAVQRLFSPALVNFLLSNFDDTLRLEAAGQWIVLTTGKKLPAESWKSFLEQSSQIARGLFDHCAVPALATAIAN